MAQRKYGFILVLAAFAFGPAALASDYDAAKLRAEGEVYVVALHDAYAVAAKDASSNGERAVADYFRDRVIEIENGGELFPMHPSVYPCTDETESKALTKAYEEIFALTASEAADTDPERVASAQVAYEEWLIAMNTDPKDLSGRKLASAFEIRMREVAGTTPMSALYHLARHQTAG